MAKTTVDYAEKFFWHLPHFVRSGTTFMGYDIPANVRATAQRYDINTDTIHVLWWTTNGNTHTMQFESPRTPDSITALLVSMRLSC